MNQQLVKQIALMSLVAVLWIYASNNTLPIVGSNIRQALN